MQWWAETSYGLTLVKMTCSTSVHTHAHGKRMNGTDCVWVGWRRVLHHSNLLPAVASLASLHAANLLVFLQILNFCPKQLLAISYHDSEIWPKAKPCWAFQWTEHIEGSYPRNCADCRTGSFIRAEVHFHPATRFGFHSTDTPAEFPNSQHFYEGDVQV